jgi:hypothetical protein
VSAFLACVALRPPHTPHLRVTEIRVKHIGDEFQALWQGKVIDKPASDCRPQAPLFALALHDSGKSLDNDRALLSSSWALDGLRHRATHDRPENR